MECNSLTCDDCGKPVESDNVRMCPKGHRNDLIFCSDACLDKHLTDVHNVNKG